jgi:hypothetical protein
MDADGIIGGLIPGQPGNYDGYANGVLTVRTFETGRFSSIAAVTELFHVLAADPEYTALSPADVLGVVAPGQRIRIFVSSTKADDLKPLVPRLTDEIAAFEVAVISSSRGSIAVTVTGDATQLNPDGGPNRDCFARVIGKFEYTNGVEAALGPFASLDRVTLSYVFNR